MPLHLTVTLDGILRDYLPSGSRGRPLELDLEEGITARAVAERLGIPTDALYLAILDNKPISLDARLPQDGHMRMFPPAVGG